jgi:hypothetical protein
MAMETGMDAEALCKSYLNALNRSDLSAVCSLFTADAVAHSPLYGVRPARAFYAELFADTSRSETTLLNIFDSSSNGSAAALHFRYVWTLKSGKAAAFECVDVFELSEDRNQFTKIVIIYDTAQLRADFETS